MKPYLLVLLIASLLPGHIHSQTADAWVTQGRTYLGKHDLADADNCFSNALTVSKTNQTANAFYAITRLLVLPNQPPGSNFLTRLGLPSSGRNIYNWTAMPPKDTNGLVLAPDGVNANEFPAQLRTNVLLAIAGAISNLSLVTETNFTVTLSSNETTTVLTTVDYGDLRLIQAGLYAAKYFTYTLNGQDFNAQLTSLRALYQSGGLTASRVLADYPQLLTVATTNDLPLALESFTNAVNTYLLASEFIRSRATNDVRLFNYDPDSLQTESNFRSVLQELKASLTGGPQVLALNTNLTVNMAPQFADRISFRGLLPKFDGNAVELGSLPDSNFDGVVDGLTLGDVEGFLGKHLTMLPVGYLPEFSTSNTLSLAFTTLQGHQYVLENSTNLSDWQIQTNFTATDTTSTLVSHHSPGLSQLFYRLRDDTQ